MIRVFSPSNMVDCPRKRYSRSPSLYATQSQSRSSSRSRSWSRPRGRSRSRSRNDVGNPGNTLFVTGLSTRVTERGLEDHFSKEEKVASCFLVVEPCTRASCGFAFITMDTVDDANRCIKHLMLLVVDGCWLLVYCSRWFAATTAGLVAATCCCCNVAVRRLLLDAGLLQICNSGLYLESCKWLLLLQMRASWERDSCFPRWPTIR